MFNNNVTRERLKVSVAWYGKGEDLQRQDGVRELVAIPRAGVHGYAVFSVVIFLILSAGPVV
jgi:hypothetical protein